MLLRTVERPGAGGSVAVTDDTTYRNALTLQSMLLEYRLESVLGAGGFGMTYLGWDSHLEKHVAIKEYLPGELAIRALDGSIVPVSTESEYDYKWGLERFIQEARTLARFSHPNIVRVNRFFEANGTSYMVMDYEAGESLFQYLQHTAAPDAALLKGILLPILDGLAAIHDSGFLHRDIKPSNVFIRANGSPLLIDFGAARLARASKSNPLTAIVSPGYAPLEQYSVDGNQGPWSDIYALSGVMFRAVTGENPPDAVKRIKADIVPAALAAARTRYDERFLKAIEWGMKTDERLRPQNVAEWRDLFSGRMSVSALNRAAANDATLPPRATATMPPARTAAAAATPKVSARPFVTQSALRTDDVASARWTWLRRGALCSVVAIALGAYAKQRPPEHALQKPPVREQVRPSADPQSQAARRFDAADTARSGDLSREELTQRLPRFASRFDEIDTNHDGVVSLRELEQFLEKDGATDAVQRAGTQSMTMPVPASFAGGPPVVAPPADTSAPPDMPQDMRRSAGEAFRRDPSPDARGAGVAESMLFAIKKEFMGADRDADGYLSFAEVRGRFPAIERNFAEVDGDRDGRISLDEFREFRRRQTAGKLPQS
jgi:serine/threonine protein kinase